MSRHGNRAFDKFLTPWEETYPGRLRDNGYFVGHVGKWHNGQFPQEYFDFGRSYSGKHWTKDTNGETIHVTARNERDALAFLTDRPSNKPFCLTVAFFATHAEDENPKQYLPQPKSMELYKDVLIPTPKTASDEFFKKLPPFIANEKNEGRNRWHWRFDTPERYQEYMKNYYRLATEVDSACGKVIAELGKNGLLEQTLVIFTTDNGYFHAEHGLADKWYPYEESIRVPLIIRDPRLPISQRGQTNDALTLNVDLAPTILTAASMPIPVGMQGRDVSELYLSRIDVPWRTDFYYEHATIKNTSFIPASEALVSREWKYLYWPDFNYEQLFDLTKDPLEESDLAQDPSAASQLSAMRTRFKELRAAAK
jgi:arylsulfatase